jgi:hypothetical protein
VDGLSLAQAFPDEIKVSLRRCDALGRFLLERVEDVQDALEPYRVDRAVGVAVEVVANLQNAAAKTFEGLGARGMVAELGLENRLAEFLSDLVREFPEVLPA